MTPVCVCAGIRGQELHYRFPRRRWQLLAYEKKLSIPSSPQIQSLCNSLINKERLQPRRAAFKHHHISGVRDLYGSGIKWEFLETFSI